MRSRYRGRRSGAQRSAQPERTRVWEEYLEVLLYFKRFPPGAREAPQPLAMQIEPYTPHHRDAVIHLSLRAWAPVFDSLQKAMDLEVYREFYPNWRASQQKASALRCYEVQ